MRSENLLLVLVGVAIGLAVGIGGFTGDIANLPRIVTINNVSLTAGKDNMLTMEAVAKTFRYLDKEEVAAQRKANAPKGAKK